MIDWLRGAALDGALDPEMELNGQSVPITLRRHARAKRLTLRLAPDASEIRITLPHWARSTEAIAFAHTKHGWLEAQHGKIPRRSIPQNGGEISFRGATVRIEWQEKAPRRPLLDDGRITLGGPGEGLQKRLQSWLERQALDLFEEDARHYCDISSLDPVPVALSRAQKRWGSCSDKARIRLNWRLIQAPDFVRRSVVAHEVTHLVHFDHSPAFHAMLGNIYEHDIKAADRWLREHGRTLYTSFG
ncbi:MAG: SprT family zinc-dependent metalloprotease [Pseudomonadota bacterium]